MFYVYRRLKGCNSGMTEHTNLDLSKNDKRNDEKSNIYNSTTTIAAITTTTAILLHLQG